MRNYPETMQVEINGRTIIATRIEAGSTVYRIDIDGKPTHTPAGYDSYDGTFYISYARKKFASLEQLAAFIDPTITEEKKEEEIGRKVGLGYATEIVAKKIAAVANPGDFNFEQPTDVTEHGLVPTLSENTYAAYYASEFLGTVQHGTVFDMIKQARKLLIENLSSGWLGFDEVFAN